MQATDALYTAEGRRLMQELEVPEYLAHVEKRISEENERVLHYLDVGTRYTNLIYSRNIYALQTILVIDLKFIF